MPLPCVKFLGMISAMFIVLENGGISGVVQCHKLAQEILEPLK